MNNAYSSQEIYGHVHFDSKENELEEENRLDYQFESQLDNRDTKLKGNYTNRLSESESAHMFIHRFKMMKKIKLLCKYDII
jgi:hypothetical protein